MHTHTHTRTHTAAQYRYDNCGDQNTIGTPESRYPVMRDALNATGRPIVFAACEWAVDFPATWMAPVANSWRTTYDIQNMWECVVPHIDWTNIYASFAGPGHFNGERLQIVLFSYLVRSGDYRSCSVCKVYYVEVPGPVRSGEYNSCVCGISCTVFFR